VVRGARTRVCVVKVLSACMAKRPEVTFTFHWLRIECSRFLQFIFILCTHKREWNVGKYIGFPYKIEVRFIKLLTKKDLNITELCIDTLQGLGLLQPPHYEILQNLNIRPFKTDFRLNTCS
jgi:hypothetical protein